MKKEWGENRWRRIARFRLRNEIREGRYWEEEIKRRCIYEGETKRHGSIYGRDVENGKKKKKVGKKQ